MHLGPTLDQALNLLEVQRNLDDSKYFKFLKVLMKFKAASILV